MPLESRSVTIRIPATPSYSVEEKERDAQGTPLFVFLVKELRLCHSKKYQFGWKYLKNSRHRKGYLTHAFYPEHTIKSPTGTRSPMPE
jgi:hypothetical protein